MTNQRGQLVAPQPSRSDVKGLGENEKSRGRVLDAGPRLRNWFNQLSEFPERCERANHHRDNDVRPRSPPRSRPCYGHKLPPWKRCTWPHSSERRSMKRDEECLQRKRSRAQGQKQSRQQTTNEAPFRVSFSLKF